MFDTGTTSIPMSRMFESPNREKWISDDKLIALNILTLAYNGERLRQEMHLVEFI